MVVKKPPPKSLSHYTTITGMMGIVENRCLWASNASFLNDSSELTHALSAARTAIERLSSKKALNHWLPTLEKVVEDLEGGKLPDTYVTCFCQSDDNLSQWRGYGGREQGVSITFNRQELQRILRSEKARLYKVTYSNITTASKLKEALEEELVELAELDEVLGISSTKQEKREILNIMSRLLPKFKHYGFRDEREWRFVVQRTPPKNSMCFRSGSNRIIPYIKLGVDGVNLPIVSIRVGPGTDQRLSEQSIRAFLDAKGYEHVKVTRSNIPFRT